MKKYLLTLIIILFLCSISYAQPISGGIIGGSPNATESTKGIAKLASDTDATTGTDDAKIMTPRDTALAIAAIPGIGASEVYGSGWNGDTSTPQKNDVYDYLHLLDTNDDGDIDTIDSTLWATKLNASEKAAASGVASLDGSSKVVQDPANATATPAAAKIPIADGSGKLDSWINHASSGVYGTIDPASPPEMGGTTPAISHNRRSPKVVSSTPVTLTTAEMANGVVYIKTGASVINLPAGASALDGVTCEFRLVNAVAASVDPNGTDVIDREGTDLTGGNKLTFSGVAGEGFKLTWSNTDSRWRTSDMNGVITDGGA